MPPDTCDPKDKWPLRNDCDAKNIRSRRAALSPSLRAANAGVQIAFRRGLSADNNIRKHNAAPQTSFRRGVTTVSPIRPEFHDTVNFRSRRDALGDIFHKANAIVRTLFRHGLPASFDLRNYSAGFQVLFHRGMIPASSIRPEFHCTPRPAYVLTPVYNEKREFVYNEAGVLVFCEIQIV